MPKLYCPVCKRITKHEYAFFDTIFCVECKVLRILRHSTRGREDTAIEGLGRALFH